MRLTRSLFAPALLAFTAGAASAAPQGASPFVLRNTGFETSVAAIVPAGNSSDAGACAHERDGWLPPGWEREPATRNDAIRYRNRGSHSRRSGGESPFQIHLGFFDSEGDGSTSFVGGLRGGPQIDRHIQIGGAVDWVHRSEDQTVVAGDPYTQGGTVITPTRVLSRASSNLFPIQLFMQLSADQDMSVIPFGGIAGGYHLLFLSADDFDTQTTYDASFGGWGWQAWVGAGIPLSGQSRLTGEVFMSQSNPERTVADPNGFEYVERVEADGVGMRFGLQWGF
ncbi:MAG: hypothetical protein ABIS67_06830 [Candidatus Eisenbacteria bacterium]